MTTNLNRYIHFAFGYEENWNGIFLVSFSALTPVASRTTACKIPARANFHRQYFQDEVPKRKFPPELKTFDYEKSRIWFPRTSKENCDDIFSTKLEISRCYHVNFWCTESKPVHSRLTIFITPTTTSSFLRSPLIKVSSAAAYKPASRHFLVTMSTFSSPVCWLSCCQTCTMLLERERSTADWSLYSCSVQCSIDELQQYVWHSKMRPYRGDLTLALSRCSWPSPKACEGAGYASQGWFPCIARRYRSIECLIRAVLLRCWKDLHCLSTVWHVGRYMVGCT